MTQPRTTMPACCTEAVSAERERITERLAKILGESVAEANQFLSETEIRAELAEKDQLEELRRKRELPWIDRWRAEQPGRELTLPDYGKFLHWLFDQLDVALAAEAEAQRLSGKAQRKLAGAESIVRQAAGRECWCAREGRSYPEKCVRCAALAYLNGGDA